MAFDAEAPREARGVTYTESEHAPGLKLFRCDAYRCTLSTKACGDRWTRALEAHGEEASRLAACRTCSIGSVHAGHGIIHYSRHYGSGVCARCGRGGFRIIGGRLCISCWNRARELRLGRNARGNKPIELMQKPLCPVELLVAVDGEVRALRDRETSGLVESLIQVLRTTKGEIAFGFAGAGIQRQHGGADAAAGAEVLDAPDEPDAADCADCGEPAPLSDVDGRHRQVCRYRARLFAGAALVAAKKEPAAVEPRRAGGGGLSNQSMRSRRGRESTFVARVLSGPSSM